MLLDPKKINFQVEKLTGAVEMEDAPAAVQITPGLSAPRIADVLRHASAAFIVSVLKRMPPERSGRVLGNLPHEMIPDVFDASDDNLIGIFPFVPPDQAVDILQHMAEDDRKSLLANLESDRRHELQRLSSYKAGTAGSVMTSRFVAVSRNCTVRETIDALLTSADETERPAYVYVQDDSGGLLGIVSLKDLIRCEPSQNIGEVMNPHVVTVQTDDSATDAARLLRDRRFTALPVVDSSGRMVGMVTFEDAMNIISRDVAESFISLEGSSDESFFTPPMGAVRKRMPWMALNVFLNLGAVTVITGFEATIAQVAILAAFLPMITDMGGNVGIQALSVAIRSQALGESKMRDFKRAARKEMLVGLVNGLALGILFAIIAFLWRGNLWLGALAGVALGLNVLLAGVVGGCLPFLFKAFGKDPAMMTGPFLTTVTDISGVSVYLGLSTMFLTRLTG